ncbi:hypothetical protein ASG31_17165 [Chryseobacterium sp. Leaf404]|uniref:transposase n=1 Tax=unclassified Chryseobacterium TaxID=2593645 RepID=UPI0006FADBF5|nr:MULTISPECIES: transposase [unclassified Chryseobacterium]KQT20903.1 hypothetical protein ASG31_17165 [Chryseobacterium sp. Leaf404]
MDCIAKSESRNLIFSVSGFRKAYHLVDGLRKIYDQNVQKSVAMLKLAQWCKEVEESGFKAFSLLT